MATARDPARSPATRRRRTGHLRSASRTAGRAAVWLALVLVVSAVTWAAVIERWSDSWGASAEEVAMVLPGDGLVADPALVTTRAISVRVPPEDVWSWIAQFGQGRGGLYSYDWLERLVGVDMHSADTVLEHLQDPEVGDQVWITQPGYPADLGMQVVEVVPGRTLVLAFSTPSRPTAPEDSAWTWSFTLLPEAGGGTRLLARQRNASVGPVGDVIWDRVVGPIGFAMERATLHGIAQRAEARAGLETGWAQRETLWFAALLVTGAAIAALPWTGAALRLRSTAACALTAAATMTLLRWPSAVLAVLLAAASVATLAWLRSTGARRRAAATPSRPEPSQVPAGV
jgi:hypothetical protein